MRILSPLLLFPLVALFSIHFAQAAGMNWDALEKGAFEVTFVTCTADGFPALTRLQLSAYSPMDVPPEGYTQATKEEVSAVASKIFAELYTPVVSKGTTAEVTKDTYLSDIATEVVTVQDENGQDVQDSLVNLSMNIVKFELMKNMKYSGMAVGYENSHVFVNNGAKCTPATPAK